MKTTIACILCLTAVVLLGAGCAAMYPPGGSVYATLNMPLVATSNQAPMPMKIGTATCKSFFGVYAAGDVSLQTAMKNGNITKVHHVDWQVKNIIGVATYKLTVYGE